MSSLHLGYLLDKLYNIDKQLGGSAQTSQNKNDDFSGLKDVIHQGKVDQKINNINKPRDADAIKLDIEIRDLMGDIENILNKMNDALRKQAKDKKKYTEQNIQAKQKAYANLRQQFFDIQQVLDPNAGIAGGSSETQTNTELRSKLMGEDGVRRPPPPREATQQEKEAIQRWEQNDQMMDGKLDIILVGTGQWVENAKKIGAQIDHTMTQIDKLDKEVDITNAELTKQNKQLKDIVEKYRQPNKFCMDIVLVVVLLGLMGIIYTIMS